MIFGKHINGYYIRYLPFILIGILSLVVVDYMQLIIPELYRALVNGMTYGYIEEGGERILFDISYLLDEICLPLIIVIVTMIICRFLWRVCFRAAAVKMETNMRSRMFDHCKDLSLQYYQVNKVGNLMALFTNDLETVQDCFGWGVMMLCDALFLGALAIIKMYAMSPIMTVLTLIPMVLLVPIGAILDHQLEKRWDARQEAFSAISDFSQETVSGMAVVKAFVKEGVKLLSFGKLNKRNEETNVSHTMYATLLSILVTFFVEAVVCVILGYGGYLVFLVKFDAGQLVEFIGYFTAIVWPVMAVSQLVEMRSRGKASLKRISELLDAKSDVSDRDDVISDPSLCGAIEIKGLTFRYPGAERDSLKNVSVSIKAGERVGIIGKTGSGKTTLADVLLRMYNVPDGTVFVDGYDVNCISIKSLRDFIAYVPQDNFLFSDKISENIAFSRTDASEEDIQNAAKMADVHENISEFADGYDTVLGERGVTVSGGQKQRISIARALLKDAGILILDDSVSAVDVKTEKAILENLSKVRKGKTTLLIAHRVSTIEDMDKIIFIDDGEILAFGTHAELYERCSEYRTTVELQRLEDEKEGAENV